MIRRSFLYVAALLLVSTGLITGCAHKKRELYQPPAINVSRNAGDVRKSIRSVLKSYSWIIEKDTPGEIVARQMRRSHEARVKINYSKNNVKIKYLDSKNLNYHVDDDGTARIHGTYNTWVTNIERRLASELS